MKPSFLGPFGRVFERALGHEILFNPNDFDGLTLWTDTSDPTTIIESGGFISQWSDKSGNGNHLKQAVGASQPSLDGDGSILFNGVNQFLKAVPFTLDQPETIYILFQQVSSTSLATVYDGDIGDRGVLRQQTPSPDITFYAGSFIGTITTFPLGVYGVITTVVNGTSSVLQLNKEAPITGNSGGSNMGGFTLAERPGIGRYGNIKVKEVIIYNVAQDGPTRETVVDYLINKWGIV